MPTLPASIWRRSVCKQAEMTSDKRMSERGCFGSTEFHPTLQSLVFPGSCGCCKQLKALLNCNIS